jgi:hypothetical protein
MLQINYKHSNRYLMSIFINNNILFNNKNICHVYKYIYICKALTTFTYYFIFSINRYLVSFNCYKIVNMSRNLNLSFQNE